MTTFRTITLAVGLLLLAACSGGSNQIASDSPMIDVDPQAAYFLWPGAWHLSIGADGRQDYKDAMYDDCVKGDGYPDCATSQDEWFVPWSQVPVVAIPRTSSQEEVWVIRRALSIVNRSLPDSSKLKASWTNRSLVGFNPVTDYDPTEDKIPVGTMHVEIYPYDDPEGSGFGWTVGERAYALGDQIDHDLNADEDGLHEDMRWAIKTMVHEFLHALGFMGHPHGIHTSILSYRHHLKGELDNVPLVDAAVLYDMYDFGHWAEVIDLVADTLDGVQFGVYGLYDEDDEDLSALIPWVDAGYMPPPTSDALLGSASYQGGLAGIITSSGDYAKGDVTLSVNFDTGSGSARFDQIWALEEDRSRMWNRRGWTYGLNLYAQYFDSSTDPRDQDSIPDVVGAFYGWDAEVAAGTLQRPEITAAFGAERD